MRVLRVETHAHGTGPYQVGQGGDTSYNQNTRPSPYDDIPGWDDESRRGWYFGFVDLEQLLRWWDPFEVELMLGGGLQISVYEVPEHKVVVGVCQLAFDRGCATYVCIQPREEA